MMSTWNLYIFAFIFGLAGSVGYLLVLPLYGKFGQFKTTAGKFKKVPIVLICITGGVLAVLLQRTIVDNFAPLYAFLIGAGWVIFLRPIRNAFYQLQRERRNYINFMEQNLIRLPKKVEVLRVKAFVKKRVKEVSRTDPLPSFWSTIRNDDSHLVTVVKNQSPCKVIGVIGKRDILDFCLKTATPLPKKPESIKAFQIMNEEFVYAQENDTLQQVITKMHKAGLERIIVLTKDKEALGWLTEKNLRSDIRKLLQTR